MQEREYLMSSAWGSTNRFLAPWGMRVVQERWVQPHFRDLGDSWGIPTSIGLSYIRDLLGFYSES